VDRMYDDFNRETRRAVLRLYRASRDIGRYVTAAAEALSPWGIPALVIWGKRDPYISYLDAQRALGLLPEAEFILLDGSGHWPFVDNPDAVADAIVPFLSRHVRGNEPRVY
ncbi:MAG TPA: alpha/beta hydrolase, partial [Dehalococcoidia bacterium]|nr:alpha/beta hydrolase [Dehalococcoidia bacterium]